jgi:effector-binding domain-containing protein
MSNPQIDLRPALQYLGISGKVTEGVRAFADRAFPELFGWLAEHSVEPEGPPFLRYERVDSEGEPVELEAGVPVNGGVQGDERVRRNALPAGRYLTYLHVGPYRSETLPDLAAARERLLTWAESHGLEPLSHIEHFRIGPVEEPDFTKWETEFAYLIV